jgi:hypothetical protein
MLLKRSFKKYQKVQYFKQFGNPAPLVTLNLRAGKLLPTCFLKLALGWILHTHESLSVNLTK